eukprot:3885323-Amphidinium_carterae.1
MRNRSSRAAKAAIHPWLSSAASGLAKKVCAFTASGWKMPLLLPAKQNPGRDLLTPKDDLHLSGMKPITKLQF